MHLRLTPWCGVFLLSTTLCVTVSAQTRPDIAPPVPVAPPVAPGNSQRDDASQEFIRQQERERLLRQQQERNSCGRPLGASVAGSGDWPPEGQVSFFFDRASGL